MGESLKVSNVAEMTLPLASLAVVHTGDGADYSRYH